MKGNAFKLMAAKTLLVAASVLCVLFMSSCGDEETGGDNVANNGNDTSIVVEPVQNIEITIERSLDDSTDEEQLDETQEQSEEEDSEEAEKEAEDEGNRVPFNPDDAFSYCKKAVCSVDKSSNSVIFDLSFDGAIPASDDNKIYLFELGSYEGDSAIKGKTPLGSTSKSDDVSIKVSYEKKYLFSKFVPAVLNDGEYYALSYGQYITNPSSLAANTKSYLEAGKKGLLFDGSTIESNDFKNLNVKRLVYNIPLSIMIGDTTRPECPTINYEYNGKTYKFNGYTCMIYDNLFSNLTSKGYHCTAILLNDWNDKYPELIHPKSRAKTGQSLYYAFNTEEESGVRLMEATAMFLAERYSGGSHGMVYDWIIANEVNQQCIWNYMATDDLNYYAESFEKSFRTFYNAIKSNYSNARVYFSVDHDWNDNDGNNSKFFNSRDFLYAFNDAARKRGNYNWSLALHPYPDPLPNVKFWEGQYDKSEKAKVLTPMNLSAATSLMTSEKFLDANGNVRKIAVTELGFGSGLGENLQAAAYAYCYYIIENNKYINAFLLNRQTDSVEEMKAGLAFGLYTVNYTPKYVANVFSKVDTKEGEAYIPEMLQIIGASSLEEALSWAK